MDDRGVAHVQQLPGAPLGSTTGIDQQVQTAEEVTREIAQAVAEATTADERAARELNRVAAAADLFRQGRLGIQRAGTDLGEGESEAQQLAGPVIMALSRSADFGSGGAVGLERWSQALDSDAEALTGQASQLARDLRAGSSEAARLLPQAGRDAAAARETASWAAGVADSPLARFLRWSPLEGVAGKLPLVGVAVGAASLAAEVWAGENAGKAGLTAGLGTLGGAAGGEAMGALLGSMAIPGVGEAVLVAVGTGAAAALIGWGGEKLGDFIWDHRAGMEHAFSSAAQTVVHGLSDARKRLFG